MGTQREELEAELVELHKRVSSLTRELNAVVQDDNNQKYSAIFQDGITLEKVMAMAWGEFGNGPNSTWYRKVSDWFNQQQGLTEYTSDAPLRGVYQDGYNPDTTQILFKVLMDANIPLEDQLGLGAVLPLTKPHEGLKIFRIFRHDCGAQGAWYLVVSEGEPQTFEIWESFSFRRRGQKHANPEASFPDMLAALSYIRTHHPYEKLKGSDDDDDDEY